MQDGQKAVWSIPYVSVAFFPSLKHNFNGYRSSSRPDCIFEIHQLWQSVFCRVYSNCCCSCSFKSEIIKIGHSSHKMYSNNVLNFQEFLDNLKCLYKNVWKPIECNIYIGIWIKGYPALPETLVLQEPHNQIVKCSSLHTRWDSLTPLLRCSILQKAGKTPLTSVLVMAVKKSNGEAPLMLDLWGMWSTSLLPSLQGPLWPEVIEPERVLYMCQIELNCVLMLNWIVWNRILLTFKLPTYAKLNCLK